MPSGTTGAVRSSHTPTQPRDDIPSMIHTSLRAGLCLLAFAGAQAADWTSFKLGRLNSYIITYAHQSDGRLLLGTGGTISVQKTFGNPALTPLSNGSVAVDPSFIATSSATSGIIGAGGFSGPSGLHAFNPSSTGTPLVQTALATLQNYVGVYWKNPVSGREGWLIGGGNGTGGAHNVTFVSSDGAKVGAITGDLSTYSAGIAADAAGNLYTALSEPTSSPDAANDEKVIKFAAAQVDAAVLAVLNNSPAPVSRASATLVHQFQSTSSIAVDGLGRIWAAGYKTNTLEVHDPALNATRTFTPDHAPLADAAGPPTYQVAAFRRSGVDYVSYLAIDSFYTLPSDFTYGCRPAEQLIITLPKIAASAATQTVGEGDGTAVVTVNLSVTGTTRITVPYTITGTAKRPADVIVSTSPLVFERGETSKTITVTLKEDVLDEPDETIVITLGNPSPAWSSELGVQTTHTLTITDNDMPPQFSAGDLFASAKVGTSYAQAVGMVVDPNPTTTRFTAKGLPAGLKIDPLTGVISGRPTMSGEFFEIVITATNASGTTRSQAFVLQVEDFADAAKGTFLALSGRLDSEQGNLGARLDLTTTSSATFTGKLSFGGVTHPISGPLDTSGTNPGATLSITRPGKSALQLGFELGATTGAVSGTLSDGGPAVSLVGWRGRAGSAITGIHHFAAPLASPTAAQPVGATHGAITLGANGSTNLAARLADGTSIGSSGLIGPAGEVMVYQKLYTIPGSVLGVLNIASDIGQTVSGSLSWTKPAQPNASTAHPDGWASQLTILAQGGKYRPVSGSTIVLALPASAGTNALLLFTGVDVDSSATEPDVAVRILAPAAVAAPNLHKLKINAAQGTFSGTIVLNDPQVKRTIPFEGRLVPDTSTPALFDGVGKGFFLAMPLAGGSKLSGMVTLTH